MIKFLLPVLVLLNFINNTNQINSQEDWLELILLSHENGAKCLDGSPASIYYKQGQNENKNKFIFNFQGGAWCGQETLDLTLANCVDRSKTDLGSSDLLPKKILFSGLFSVEEEKNPNFYDYTQVIVNYCDGSGHQGYSERPYNYDDSIIWFRGQANTLEAFNYAMSNLGMKEAETIIISGQSAGGLACFTWVDELEDRIKKQNKNTKVFGNCDSGIFMNFENMQTQTNTFETSTKNFMLLSNSSTPPVNKKCAQKYASEWWKCMFAQYLLEFVNSQVFISNAEYDSWALQYIAGVACIKDDQIQGKCTQEQQDYIEKYRNDYYNTILEILERKNNLSIWTPACMKHCFDLDYSFNSEQWEIPAKSGGNLENILNQFVSNGERILKIDNEPWPSNLPCSGLVNMQQKYKKHQKIN